MRAGDETEVLGCSGIGWGESQATGTWRQFLRFGSRKIPGSAFPSCPLPCSLQWEGWLPDVPDVPKDSSAFNPERVKRKPCNLWVEKTTAVAFPPSSPPLVLWILLPWPVALLAAGLTAARDYAMGEKESKAGAN